MKMRKRYLTLVLPLLVVLLLSCHREPPAPPAPSIITVTGTSPIPPFIEASLDRQKDYVYHDQELEATGEARFAPDILEESTQRLMAAMEARKEALMTLLGKVFSLKLDARMKLYHLLRADQELRSRIPQLLEQVRDKEKKSFASFRKLFWSTEFSTDLFTSCLEIMLVSMNGRT